MANQLGVLAAAALGFFFGVSGAAKLFAPDSVGDLLESAQWRITHPRLAGIGAALAELVLAVCFFAGLPGASIAAIALVAFFSAVLVKAIINGSLSSLGCWRSSDFANTSLRSAGRFPFN